MNSSSKPDELSTIANLQLLLATFKPLKPRNRRIIILELYSRCRRSKLGDFKLLAAYVAAYIGVLILKEDY
jgi:hypothetical protein